MWVAGSLPQRTQLTDSPACRLSESTTMFMLRMYFHLPISMHREDIRTLIGAFGLGTPHQSKFSLDLTGVCRCSSRPLPLFSHNCQICLQSMDSPCLLLLPYYLPIVNITYCPVPCQCLHCRATELTHLVNKPLPMKRTENELKANYCSVF